MDWVKSISISVVGTVVGGFILAMILERRAAIQIRKPSPAVETSAKPIALLDAQGCISGIAELALLLVNVCLVVTILNTVRENAWGHLGWLLVLIVMAMQSMIYAHKKVYTTDVIPNWKFGVVAAIVWASITIIIATLGVHFTG